MVYVILHRDHGKGLVTSGTAHEIYVLPMEKERHVAPYNTTNMELTPSGFLVSDLTASKNGDSS